MKSQISSYCVAVMLAAATWLNASEPVAAKQCSPEFARIKSLVGTWTGKADIGQGPIDMTVQYRLLAGGSVVEERVFAGTPNEMVTMFFDKGGQLALTHYCMLGNQPGMVLKSSDAKSLKFDFDKNCGITPTETHMHSMMLTFSDADTITASCKLFVGGEAQPEHPTTLKRVKS